MKKVMVCLLLIALPGLIYCADDSKRKNVEKLLVLFNAEAMIDTIYSQMEQTINGIGQQLGVSPSEQEMFDEFVSKSVSVMKSEMNWAKMEEPLIQIYLKHYTAKEIQDMVDFYTTESGKSMIKKMPEVMKDSMLLGQEIVKAFIPKIEAMAREFEEDLLEVRQEQ